jgi:Uma2 family endonuclease
MAVEYARYRFTVEEYDEMGRAGILGEDARVELIDGEIVEMSPIKPPHQSHVDRLNDLLVRHAGHVAIVRVQGPFHLDRRSEPQPDVLVLRRRDDYYAGRHPRPDDVLLAIEVADSSLAYDREIKMPRYARNGVVESWIVPVGTDAIDVYREPTPEGYRLVRRFRRGERITLVAAPNVELSVEEIIGPAPEPA